MTYIASGGALNSTHSLTADGDVDCCINSALTDVFLLFMCFIFLFLCFAFLRLDCIIIIIIIIIIMLIFCAVRTMSYDINK